MRGRPGGGFSSIAETLGQTGTAPGLPASTTKLRRVDTGESGFVTSAVTRRSLRHSVGVTVQAT